MAARNSRVKARTRGGSGGSSDLAVTVVASISIVLPLLFYLHEHVEMLRCGYEIESLETTRLALVERSRQLAVDREAGAGAALVEERAAQLGLVAPASTDVRAVAKPTEPVDVPSAVGGPAPEEAARNAFAAPTAPVPPTAPPTAPAAVVADMPCDDFPEVGSSRVDLQACKLEYSIVSPK